MPNNVFQNMYRVTLYGEKGGKWREGGLRCECGCFVKCSGRLIRLGCKRNWRIGELANEQPMKQPRGLYKWKETEVEIEED